MYQTSTLNVEGRSSAEEAAAARAISCQIGDSIWSKNNEHLEENIEKESLHPTSAVSKKSITSNESLEIRNYDGDDGISDDDGIQLQRADDQESIASSASNYSFSAAVAPNSMPNIEIKTKNSSSIKRRNSQRSIRR